ncbi:Na/Pi symporter [Anditalea andensis]|uniref:Phosphate transporter n=1 Tax=Anditalea andensis TaxID=1048983 RepID=A0A074KQ22_9BACT|nr:Na/Pi symporter [Anditalea andensis]KEO72046.1 phosphate transporter [Anditalea andensis]
MSKIQSANGSYFKLIMAMQLVLAFVLFVFSIDLLTYSLGTFSNDVTKDIFTATLNPFVGLFIGLLMTAMFQSSSMITAMVVAVVASGSLSLIQAVPVIMGANIGTTLTSTLVSFTFIMKRNEFKRALAAGVLHDIFNILTVIILFPLELYFGFLSYFSEYLTHTFFAADDPTKSEFIYNVLITRPFTLWITQLFAQPILWFILAILLVFGSIKILSETVYKAFLSTHFKNLSEHVFKAPLLTFIYGILFTAAVQSSTVTTSLVVPAVATRKIKLAKIFPFIIGANMGTTITAIIAAIYKTEAAISIAIVHVIINLIGALIFLPFPAIRHIPVMIASFFGRISINKKYVSLAYILMTFFIIPFLLIYFNKKDDVQVHDARSKEKNKEILVPKKTHLDKSATQQLFF